MRWHWTGTSSTASSELPPLARPSAFSGAACCTTSGRLLLVGGMTGYNPRQRSASAMEWLPGRAAWSPLPNMTSERHSPVAILLADGRLLVAGGAKQGASLASAEVLAADGSGWTLTNPMSKRRYDAVGGLLPNGHVVVAGGRSSNESTSIAGCAETWNPDSGQWTLLPPMSSPRASAAGCV